MVGGISLYGDGVLSESRYGKYSCYNDYNNAENDDCPCDGNESPERREDGFDDHRSFFGKVIYHDGNFEKLHHEAQDHINRFTGKGRHWGSHPPGVRHPELVLPKKIKGGKENHVYQYKDVNVTEHYKEGLADYSAD